MKRPVPKQYKPSELKAAIAVLQNNGYDNFDDDEAHGFVIALHKRGYKIVYTGEPTK